MGYSNEELLSTYSDIFERTLFTVKVSDSHLLLRYDDEFESGVKFNHPTPGINVEGFGQLVSVESPLDDYVIDLFSRKPSRTADQLRHSELATSLLYVGITVADMATIIQKGGVLYFQEVKDAVHIHSLVDTYLQQVQWRTIRFPGYRRPPEKDLKAFAILLKICATVISEYGLDSVPPPDMEDLFAIFGTTATRVNVDQTPTNGISVSLADTFSAIYNFSGN